MAKPPKTTRLVHQRHPEQDMRARSHDLLEDLRARRSVREFSDEPVPLDVVRTCIETAAQAPSGANKQPWTFVLVTDPELKRRIREGAEAEERAFYRSRASEKWLKDLEPLGTDEDKPFLEIAPALIVVFGQKHGRRPEPVASTEGTAEPDRHYYVNESVGIACGFLIAALQRAGLVTLTHTPSPMKFLAEILDRPDNERPYLLLPVGYPAADCEVPDIGRKPLSDVLVEL